MVRKQSSGRSVFLALNYLFLGVLSLLCVLPIVHVFAVSLSSSRAVSGGAVSFWPVDFTLASYEYVLQQNQFAASFLISVERVVLGTLISMCLTILIAYPLSKSNRQFKWRTRYVWFFVITMLFNGGLIPWYMVIKSLGMIDSLSALVLPGAVSVFNVVLLLNFFRELPAELDEAARIDGATQFQTLWKIYVPLSKPALATLTLFCLVGGWNSWFDGLILMNRPKNYPLQSYLQTVIFQIDYSHISDKDLSLMQLINNRTNRAAQIFVATFPILCVYPFLQTYFTKGIVMGSVKG